MTTNRVRWIVIGFIGIAAIIGLFNPYSEIKAPLFTFMGIAITMVALYPVEAPLREKTSILAANICLGFGAGYWLESAISGKSIGFTTSVPVLITGLSVYLWVLGYMAKEVLSPIRAFFGNNPDD